MPKIRPISTHEFLSSVLILGNYTRSISAFRPGHLSFGNERSKRAWDERKVQR